MIQIKKALSSQKSPIYTYMYAILFFVYARAYISCLLYSDILFYFILF